MEPDLSSGILPTTDLQNVVWGPLKTHQIGICGGTLSEHGTSVPIGSTVISGLKSRAPTTTNINLLVSFEFLEVPEL